MNMCFECNQSADHNHHVVPKVLGGTRTVPLCETCHGKIHGKRFLNHRTLTKAGLERAKQRGVKLGNPSREGLQRAWVKAIAARRKAAKNFVAAMLPVLQDYQQQGYSLRAIAEDLNKKGTPTRRGGKWTATQLCRMLRLVTQYPGVPQPE